MSDGKGVAKNKAKGEGVKAKVKTVKLRLYSVQLSG
jgi:hypothetical protein